MDPIGSTLQRSRTAPMPGPPGKPRTVKAAVPPARTSTAGRAAADQQPARQRDDLIAAHMPMATRIARSFSGRGEDLEDLTQVAMLELVRTVDLFDPAREIPFAQYAYPCIVGALKRHFRDSGWSLRVTRRIQELSLQTSKAIPVLTQLLGRTPTVSDLALYLHLSEKDTRDGLHGLLAYQTWSLNMPAGDNQDVELGQLLGGLDAHLEAVPDRYALAQHVAGLSARDRAMLYLRFIGDLSQREIGEQLGLSQMHVSRLLSGCLDRLRELMLAQN